MAKSNPYNDYGLTGKVSTKKYTKNNNPYDSYGRDNQTDALAEQKTYRQQLADKMVKQKAQTKKQADEQVRQQAKQGFAAKVASFGKEVGKDIKDVGVGTAKTVTDIASVVPKARQVLYQKYGDKGLAKSVTPHGKDPKQQAEQNKKDISKAGKEATDFARFLPRAVVQLGESVPASKHPTEQGISVNDRAPGIVKLVLGKEPIPSIENVYKTSKQQKGTPGALADTAVTLGGDLLALKGGRELKKNVETGTGVIKAATGKDKATNNLITNQKVAGRMSLGKATDDLQKQKDNLTQLKTQHPNAPELDKAIQNVDKKIVEVQKTSDKQAVETQKTTEKNATEVKKIDQQTELIQAKKKDTGKTSAVDTVKLKQLKERKAEIQSESPVVTSKSPVVYAKPSTESTPVQESPTTVKASTPKVPDTTSGSASRVYQRLKAEHPELTEDVSYQATTLKRDAEKAVSVLAEDKQKAFRIATGQETSPDVTSTSTNIAMAEKALQEGNHKLYARLVKSRSLDQTRRGQELVAEKGSITDNSTSRYVKELIGIKLDKVGKQYLGDVRDRMGQTSSKQRATKAIDREVDKLEKQIRNRRLDTKTALALLDKIECQ